MTSLAQRIGITARMSGQRKLSRKDMREQLIGASKANLALAKELIDKAQRYETAGKKTEAKLARDTASKLLENNAKYLEVVVEVVSRD